jgi:hypothetical protein
MSAIVLPFRHAGPAAASATTPATVVTLPVHPSSLTARDIAALLQKSFMPKLAGQWLRGVVADDDGDLYASVARVWRGSLDYAAFLVARHGTILRLIDGGSGETLGDCASIETLREALGDAIGWRRSGHP